MSKPDKPLNFTEIVSAVGVVSALYETDLVEWGARVDLKDIDNFDFVRDKFSALIQGRAMGGELPLGAIASCQVIAHIILTRLRSYQCDVAITSETLNNLAYDICENSDKWSNLYDFSRFSKK